MRILSPLLCVCIITSCVGQRTYKSTEVSTTTEEGKFPIVDSKQEQLFNNRSAIELIQLGEPFYGQDAQHNGNQPSYTDQGDGTIQDNVTGLVWQAEYMVMSYTEAIEKLKTFKLAGKTDWRLPTIKEAYSLILFNGKDISSKEMSKGPYGVPFIDTNFFEFEYGSNGPRPIDVQILSSTIYMGKTMGRDQTVFGVNVADGRIKGYPLIDPRSRSEKKYTVRFVRGNIHYGRNNFQDNLDETISDLASGLMWSKNDSQKYMNWEQALAYAQQMNDEEYLGHSDWRLPNVKELQSIVDYTRSPQETNSAAINDIFAISEIQDEGGGVNYPSYWSSTTHQNIRGADAACYVSFGEALGYFGPPHSRDKELLDVHGAGAQRSDPKSGDANNFPQGRGPQGDVIRINNYARLVRDL